MNIIYIIWFSFYYQISFIDSLLRNSVTHNYAVGLAYISGTMRFTTDYFVFEVPCFTLLITGVLWDIFIILQIRKYMRKQFSNFLSKTL